MRSFVIILWMLTSALAIAASNDYEERRELTLNGSDIDTLQIEAGSGSLSVRGVSGLDDVEVTAGIVVPDRAAEQARAMIKSDLTLRLERSGHDAVLKSYFDHRGFGDSPLVNLEVRMPAQLALEIVDGSGSITIQDVSGNIKLDDGSGSISMDRVGGDVTIEDGSGSIRVSGVGGDLSVTDGSGSINAEAVGGSMIVDDGSGSIKVHDVEKDLIILDDGSGSVDYSDVRGQFSSAR